MTCDTVCLDRALRLYLQQAPLEVLVDELKTSAAAGSSSWGSLAFQEKVAADVIGSQLAEKFPPRFGYTSRLTKLLLEESELSGEEPAEALLLARMPSAFGAKVTDGVQDEAAYESFWLPPTVGGLTGNERDFRAADQQFLSFRVANRDNEVGLRVWEAGRVLADFCLARSEWLKGKRVLELGAGIGMTGMAIACCCGVEEVVLTDYAPRVLANLRFNLEVNRPALDSREKATRMTVRSLDWTDYAACKSPVTRSSATATTVQMKAASSHSNEEVHRMPASVALAVDGDHSGISDSTPADETDGLRQHRPVSREEAREESMESRYCAGIDSLGLPEVLLAADVVYDSRFHPALVGVVAETLRRCPDALVIFASTLRNEATLSAFHRCLEEAGVPWRSADFSATDHCLSWTEIRRTDGVNANGAGVPQSSEARPPQQGPSEDSDSSSSSSQCPCMKEGILEDRLSSSPAHGSRHCTEQSHRCCLRLWSHPGEVERVRLSLCGRRAL